MQPLVFSSDFLTISKATLGDSLVVDRPSIVINMSEIPVIVEADDSAFTLLESRLLQNTSVSGAGATIVVIQTPGDDFMHIPSSTKRAIQTTWSYANPLAVDTDRQAQHAVHKSNILKSVKDVVNGYHLFFCFQQAEARGRIHRFHEIYEVHTQILGLGAMQKYKEESYDSVFATANMAPGSTHYPFYKPDKSYPWHTYVSATDSVWLAMVSYD